MKTHEFRCYPERFAAVLSGANRALIRSGHHRVEVGDSVVLAECSRDGIDTGRKLRCRITYIRHVPVAVETLGSGAYIARRPVPLDGTFFVSDQAVMSIADVEVTR